MAAGLAGAGAGFSGTTAGAAGAALAAGAAATVAGLAASTGLAAVDGIGVEEVEGDGTEVAVAEFAACDGTGTGG